MSEEKSVSRYRLSPESIISTVLLSGLPIDRMRRREVADVLYSLEENGVDTSRMTMQMNAVSAQCWDLNYFLGRYHAFGYMSDFDPIKLTDEGVKMCKRTINEEMAYPRAKEQLDYLKSLLSRYTYENGEISIKKEEPAKTKRKFLFW